LIHTENAPSPQLIMCASPDWTCGLDCDYVCAEACRSDEQARRRRGIRIAEGVDNFPSPEPVRSCFHRWTVEQASRSLVYQQSSEIGRAYAACCVGAVSRRLVIGVWARTSIILADIQGMRAAGACPTRGGYLRGRASSI
jgi:hypothetical protein